MDYFLELVAAFSRTLKWDATYCLPFLRRTPAGEHRSAKTTGQITRDHHIHVVEGEETGLGFPVYSLVGGKWTSFRAFSEQVTDKALEFLGRKRTKNTHELPIGGGRVIRAHPRSEQLLDELAKRTGISIRRAQSLFERYGTRSEFVALFITREADKPLNSLPDLSQREIAFLH